MISQNMILNKILDTKDMSIITLNNLTEKHFFNYKAEFLFIKNHYEQYGKVPDKIVFANTFRDFQFVEVTESDLFLVQQLLRDYNGAYLSEKFNEMKRLLESDKIDEAVSFAQTTLENLRVGSALQCTDITKDIGRYDRYIDRCTNEGKYHISSGFPELDKLIGGIDRENENMVIIARTGQGKCLAKGTKVLMADGSVKNVEDVKIGDKIQSYPGINTVLALHNGISNGYKIIPNKGEPFIVSSDHILTLFKHNQVLKKNEKTKKYYYTTNNTGELVDIKIEDYLALSDHQKHQYKLFRAPIEYSTKEQSIDPYILGLWLGDGTSKYSQITTMNSEIVEALNNYAKETNQELHLLESQKKSKANVYSIIGNFQTLLREENLLNNKHIPLNYLTGNREQRLQLLAGLLDTDGCLTENTFEFVQKNKQLFDQTLQLARGLGFRVTSSKPKVVNGINYYRCHISCNLQEIPTRVSRKQVKNATNKVNPYNFGFKIEPVDYVEYFGFMCDGNSRYLLADNTITHNTWLMLKLAAAMSLQGLNVGIYSGEMTTDKVAYRLDTLMAHMKNRSISRSDKFYNDVYYKYISNLPKRNIGPIKVITPTDIADEPTVDVLKTFIEKEHLDVLCVDQYSLLEDARGGKTERDQIANISKAIKKLQVAKKIPIISVSQQNRTKNDDGKKKEVAIDTSQVYGSDRIPQDCTILLGIERDEDENESPLFKINIVKARDGGEGKVLTYRVDLNEGYFDYIPNVKDGISSKADLDALKGEFSLDLDKDAPAPTPANNQEVFA